MHAINLRPYTRRGFPGQYDRYFEDPPVAGIDRDHLLDIVRVCPETESWLYGGGYSPREVAYELGTRPHLEEVAKQVAGSEPLERARSAMDWVNRNVLHPHLKGPLPGNRGFTEEQIIDSGVGWCNEQSRVFVALCEVMEIPARMCFVFHRNAVCSHTCAEAWVNGRWTFFDVTFNLVFPLPSGELAEGRELSNSRRSLAHKLYRPALTAHYEKLKLDLLPASAWSPEFRPHPERGGDLLHVLGIANYVVEGVRAR